MLVTAYQLYDKILAADFPPRFGRSTGSLAGFWGIICRIIILLFPQVRKNYPAESKPYSPIILIGSLKLYL